MQSVKVVGGRLEDLVIGPEGDGGAGGLADTDLLHLHGCLAAGKLHLVDLAVTADARDELLRQRVDDRDADAVQAAGHLVGAVVELAARMQDREDDLERRNLLDGVEADGDAAAVILHGDRVVGMDGHLDLGTEAGHGLVDGVVDDLPHQVVQARHRRGADIHARALTNCLEALEDLDLALVVGMLVVVGCHLCVPFSRRQKSILTILLSSGRMPSTKRKTTR